MDDNNLILKTTLSYEKGRKFKVHIVLYKVIKSECRLIYI